MALSSLHRVVVSSIVLFLAAASADAGLIHRYSFSEATPKDSVGKVDATLKGEAKIVSGKLVVENGDKVGTDPKLSYLEFNSSVLPKSGSVSLAVWITAKENPLYSRVLDFGSTDGGVGMAFMYLVAFHDDDKSKGSITASDTGAKTFLDGPRLDDDKPHLAVLVVDGDAKKLRMYIDGKEVASAEDLGDNTLDKVRPEHCWLGRSSADVDPGLTGSIDEFRVYDHALSTEEIGAIQKAGADALPPGNMSEVQTTSEVSDSENVRKQLVACIDSAALRQFSVRGPFNPISADSSRLLNQYPTTALDLLKERIKGPPQYERFSAYDLLFHLQDNPIVGAEARKILYQGIDKEPKMISGYIHSQFVTQAKGN